MFSTIFSTVLLDLSNILAFLVHWTIAHHRPTPPVMLWPLLQLPSNALVFSLNQVAHQTSLSFRIFTSFILDPWHSLDQRLFYTLQCPEFLQSYSCTIDILVVQLYQQSAFLQWNTHGERLRRDMRNSLVPRGFITLECVVCMTSILICIFYRLQRHLLLNFETIFFSLPLLQ